jgi:hypothetical protein
MTGPFIIPAFGTYFKGYGHPPQLGNKIHLNS